MSLVEMFRIALQRDDEVDLADEDVTFWIPTLLLDMMNERCFLRKFI